MKRALLIAVGALTLLNLLGCGGGGGGTGSGTPAATSAIIDLSTSGTLPSGQLINGVTVTVNLPTGVTVQNVIPSGELAGTGVVTINPANTDSSKITFYTINNDNNTLSPFNIGKFATITCSIAAGNSPQPTDFSIAPGAIITSNTTFATIPGMSVTFVADIH